MKSNDSTNQEETFDDPRATHINKVNPDPILPIPTNFYPPSNAWALHQTLAHIHMLPMILILVLVGFPRHIFMIIGIICIALSGDLNFLMIGEVMMMKAFNFDLNLF